MLLFILLWKITPYDTKCSLALWPLQVGQSIPVDYGDAILVMGSGCNPGLGTTERLIVAAELYHQKRRLLILSEGTCFPHERERFLARMTDELDIQRSDIWWDTTSFSTEDNARNCRRLLDSLGLGSVVVCTSAYHQLRTWVVMTKKGPENFKLAAIRPDQKRMMVQEPYKSRRGVLYRSEYLKTLASLFR